MFTMNGRFQKIYDRVGEWCWIFLGIIFIARAIASALSR
jgi:hypothetical protein